MNPKAVLWDLDDTLLNTLPGRMTALAHAYETVVGGKWWHANDKSKFPKVAAKAGVKMK